MHPRNLRFRLTGNCFLVNGFIFLLRLVLWFTREPAKRSSRNLPKIGKLSWGVRCQIGINKRARSARWAYFVKD